MMKGLLGAEPSRPPWYSGQRRRVLGRKGWLATGIAYIILEAYAHIYGNLSATREVYKGLSLQMERLSTGQTRTIIREQKYRYEHLLYLLDHYGNADLPNLDAIFISWGLGKVDPPTSLNLSEYRIPVYLERARQNSLSERFRIPSQMRTNAALWLDDDIHIEASSVEFMFDAWQAHGKPHHRIVGRTGRMASRDKAGRLQYKFDWGEYNLILTNNAFMDKTMASWYWENDRRLSEARAYVAEVLNCEDILMNYVVARRTGLSPIMANVPGDFRPIRAPVGISAKPGHVRHRTRCLQKFEGLFGDILSKSSAVLLPSVQTEAFGENSMELPEQWRPIGPSWAEGKTYSDDTLSDP